MKRTIEQDKWSVLLRSWAESLRQVRDANAEKWKSIGLPDVEELTFRDPDSLRVSELEDTFDDLIDPELLLFYRTTNGWPIWLGSYQASIAPIGSIGLFSERFPEAFEIALENAPIRRDISNGCITLSRDELRSSVVISDIDAREFVLTLPSHETCLFYFAGMNVFNDFFAFMTFQKERVCSGLAEILR